MYINIVFLVLFFLLLNAQFKLDFGNKVEKYFLSSFVLLLVSDIGVTFIAGDERIYNKRPKSHIAHLRKQFKSLNKYDYIITLIQRIKKKLHEDLLVLHLNLNPLHPWMLCAKIG